MFVPYDYFTNAFLDKILEYDFVHMDPSCRGEIVDGYMKRAMAAFRHICKYDFTHNANDADREYEVDVDPDDLDEIVDIVSEGMLVQWMKPFLYHQDNLYGVLNTKDFTTYSRAELLMRIGNAHTSARKDFLRLMRDYSYNHGDLTDLHT